MKTDNGPASQGGSQVDVLSDGSRVRGLLLSARRLREDPSWKIIAGCVIVVFSGLGASWYAMGVFLSPLVEYFGWGRGAYSLGTSLFLATMGLGSAPIGRLTDRWGPRRVMRISAIVTGLIWILISQVGQVGHEWAIWQLYILYCLLGLAGAGVGMVPASTLIAHSFTKRRGLAMGIAAIGGSLPGVILVPLSAPLLDAYGWRPLALFLGILAIVGGFGSATWLLRNLPKRAPTDSAQATVPATLGSTAAEALRMPAFWLLGGALLLQDLGASAAQLQTIPFMMDRGMSREVASGVYGSLALAGIMGKLTIGAIADRIPSKMIAIVSMLLQASSLVIVLMWPSVTAAWLFAILFGLGMGGQLVGPPLIVQSCFGIRAFGTIWGAVMLFKLPGMTASQPIAGFLHDATGGYSLPYMIFVAALILGAVLLIPLRSPKSDPASDTPVTVGRP